MNINEISILSLLGFGQLNQELLVVFKLFF